MSSASFPVDIDISARDATSGGFSQVRNALRGFRSDVQASTAALGSERDQLFARKGEIRENVQAERLFRSEFRQRNEVFFTSARAIGQVGNAFLKVNQIFVNHNLLQQRQSELTERLSIARRRLAEAVRKEGVGSLEAQSAQATLNRLLNDQSNLARETTVQYISMSVAASSLAGDVAQVAATVGQLGFQLRSRGFTNFGSFFGRGAARTAAIPATSATTGLGATAAGAGTGLAASKAGAAAKFLGPLAGLLAGAAIGTSLPSLTPELGSFRDELNRHAAETFKPVTDFFGITPPEPTQSEGGTTVNGDVNVYVTGGSGASIVEQINREISTRSVIAGRRG